MTNLALMNSAESTLRREALLLDRREFDAWLELYDPAVEYWMPCWDEFGEATNDPRSQMSNIYYNSRAGLEERVYRIKAGKSAASKPLFRTCHFFQVLDVRSEGDRIHVDTNWHVYCYRDDKTSTNFGMAEYQLAISSLKIVRKKAIVCNELIDTVVDFYMI